ncbi:stage II sporulation protein D [Natranaerofaba carboxydovora]|uniref:stage II sporulation protein D n=1 Tax=Natranaerofaba carboxydovora TaxID=2742683 RepID=UPI001F1328C6|nr:stage II sporulation protein D [Natranaerofaba carboxydovora]UMZ75097.1 Amidase enhancer [Natranaerofaba carboxydovora]
MRKNFYYKALLKKILIPTGVILLTFVVASEVLITDEKEHEKPKVELEEKKEIPPLVEKAETKEIDTIIVYNHNKEKNVEKELEDYLVGVVAAEMPPSFDIEALKAQAVTARSYTISRLEEFGGSGCNNSSADVCTDPDHCQDWVEREEAVTSWGEDGERLWDKVVDSVEGTRGKILTYNGNPVKEAPYHSTCGGHTESSSKVWDNDKPYIESVDCGYCEHSDRYNETEKFSEDEIAKLFSSQVDNVDTVIAGNEVPIEVLSRSSTGRVMEARIGDQKVSGRDIRHMLNLNSANFELTKEDYNTWALETRGFGHGVGLCQYGADGKAKEGANYREILDYYFQDINIKGIN